LSSCKKCIQFSPQKYLKNQLDDIDMAENKKDWKWIEVKNIINNNTYVFRPLHSRKLLLQVFSNILKYPQEPLPYHRPDFT